MRLRYLVLIAFQLCLIGHASAGFPRTFKDGVTVIPIGGPEELWQAWQHFFVRTPIELPQIGDRLRMFATSGRRSTIGRQLKRIGAMENIRVVVDSGATIFTLHFVAETRSPYLHRSMSFTVRRGALGWHEVEQPVAKTTLRNDDQDVREISLDQTRVHSRRDMRRYALPSLLRNAGRFGASFQVSPVVYEPGADWQLTSHRDLLRRFASGGTKYRSISYQVVPGDRITAAIGGNDDFFWVGLSRPPLWKRKIGGVIKRLSSARLFSSKRR